MSDLIARLEAATEGSRDLDWLVAENLGEIPKHTVQNVGTSYGWSRKEGEWTLWRARDSEGRNMEYWKPKPRTTSIDAALTLVPEGANYGFLSEARAWVWTDGTFDLLTGTCGVAPTPALALTIASLKARQSSTCHKANHNQS